MKSFEVACAVFIENGKVFSAQRGPHGETGLKWEFPGGKLESGESGEQAIVREIREELQTEIRVEKYLTTVEHQYRTFFIRMHAYICGIVKGELTLNEHVDKKWLPFDEIDSVDWADADKDIVKELKGYLRDAGFIQGKA